VNYSVTGPVQHQRCSWVGQLNGAGVVKLCWCVGRDNEWIGGRMESRTDRNGKQTGRTDGRNYV
jgi:hypothetical protein